MPRRVTASCARLSADGPSRFIGVAGRRDARARGRKRTGIRHEKRPASQISAVSSYPNDRIGRKQPSGLSPVTWARLGDPHRHAGVAEMARSLLSRRRRDVQ